MKKILISIAVLCMAVIVLSGCDLYSGKRPMDYGAATWVSETPDAWFTVSFPGTYPQTAYRCVGAITINGITTDFQVTFGFGADMYFYKPPITGNSDTDVLLFRASCKFSPTKLVVTIDTDNTNILQGKVRKITFVRQTAAPVTPTPTPTPTATPTAPTPSTSPMVTSPPHRQAMRWTWNRDLMASSAQAVIAAGYNHYRG